MRYLLPFFILVAGCGKTELPVAKPVEARLLSTKIPAAKSLSAADYQGLEVEEFIVLVFKKGLKRTEWQHVFTQAQRLNTIRNQQHELDLKLAAPELSSTQQTQLETERDELLDQLPEILPEIQSKYAAMMINWTENDGCVFGGSCQDTKGVQAQQITPWTVVQPQSKDLWVYPWLESKWSQPAMTLKLKLDHDTPEQIVLNGEVVVDDSYEAPHERYGYAEVRLKKRK